MTGQEAEAWAARLERVWAPRRIVIRYVPGAVGDTVGFHYTGYFSSKLYLEVDNDDEEIHLRLFKGPVFLSAKLISSTTNAAPIWNKPTHKEEYKLLVAQWMPSFRHCCWLSGFEIEATTHEKAEWIQNFTEEELEAWNLKM